MTEFEISSGSILGLMPRDAAGRLFAKRIKIAVEDDFQKAAELYLLVDNAAAYLLRAIEAGAREISPLTSRDWGHRAGYCLDPDGHIIAFAEIADG